MYVMYNVCNVGQTPKWVKRPYVRENQIQGFHCRCKKL